MMRSDDKLVPFVEPSEGLRCARTGKRWRCKSRSIREEKYCELHYLQLQQYRQVKRKEQEKNETKENVDKKFKRKRDSGQQTSSEVVKAKMAVAEKHGNAHDKGEVDGSSGNALDEKKEPEGTANAQKSLGLEQEEKARRVR